MDTVRLKSFAMTKLPPLLSIFEKGNDAKFDLHMVRKRDWWKVDELSERIDRKRALPEAKFVESVVGREDRKNSCLCDMV